jgi:hypothetical protein
MAAVLSGKLLLTTLLLSAPCKHGPTVQFLSAAYNWRCNLWLLSGAVAAVLSGQLLLTTLLLLQMDQQFNFSPLHTNGAASMVFLSIPQRESRGIMFLN